MCLHPNLLLGCYVFRTLASGVHIVEPWLSGCTVSICVCSHTGCRLDYHRVWTSDTCKTVSGAEGFFSRSGNAAHEAKYPLHCTPATKTLGTRCCADLFKVTQPFAKYLVVVGMKLPFSFPGQEAISWWIRPLLEQQWSSSSMHWREPRQVYKAAAHWNPVLQGPGVYQYDHKKMCR